MTPGRRRSWTVVAALSVVGIVAIVVGYGVSGGGSSPPLEVADEPYATGGGEEPVPAAGAWAITDGSTAGYRVQAQLAGGTGSKEVVGHTEQITGGFTLARPGASLVVTEASFTVAVSTLTSDDPDRDRQLRTTGLETGRFPTASFVTTSPVDVSVEAEIGEDGTVDVPGDLTIHGMTKTVTIPLQVARVGNRIEIVGSLTFALDDYGIEPPSVAGVVTVDDEVTLEIDLVCAPAGAG